MRTVEYSTCPVCGARLLAALAAAITDSAQPESCPKAV